MRTENTRSGDGKMEARTSACGYFAIALVLAFLGFSAVNTPVWALDDRSQDAKPSSSPTVRIVSWDLHDLWQTPGQPLRAGAVTRSKDDFAALRARAAALRADVIALQGIGSPRAARILFPSRSYFVVFSRELAVRQQRDRDMLSNPARRRVYNAIAIRRAAKLRVLGKEHILETADPSPALGTGRPQGQSALAVKLKINKAPVWVLSARLAGGCDAVGDAIKFQTGAETEKPGEVKNRSAACTALRDQVQILKAWTSLKATKQEVVVAGISLPGSKRTASPIAWTALTHGDPVKVALAYRAQKRAAALRNAGAQRRFVLTNPLIGPVVAGANKKALQPNTVELTGPTRPAGARLVKRPSEPSDKRNFVVDALADFARAALRDKKTDTGAAKAKQLSLAEASFSGLNKLAAASVATPRQETGLSAKRVSVQYPEKDPVDGCLTDQIGKNFLVIDRAFHARTEGAQFGAFPAARVGVPSTGGSRADCAVYLDIPRSGS